MGQVQPLNRTRSVAVLNAGYSIGLAGGISSGKSTMATALASHLGLQRISFGDFVRHEVQTRGLGVDRPTLQTVGAELLDSLSADGFCRAAAKWAKLDVESTGLVWDGIRHASVANALRQLQPHMQFLLIGLRPPEIERRDRVLSEAGTFEEREAWERDSTERELESVLEMADYTCSADDPGRAIDEALSWVTKMRLLRNSDSYPLADTD